MSTLKTSNIQDTSGNNNSTPQEIGKGRAKAWINFNGENTPTARESYNVSSITDNATGNYTLNFTNAMSSADFAYTFASGDQNHTSATRALNYMSSTTTSLQILSESSNGTNSDESHICVVVFGD
tara:strand:+ start:408 stop:782 length:375 start_codon:yes stop_codon:yes gene_type:complete